MLHYEIIKNSNGKERFRNLITGWKSKLYDRIYRGCGPYFKTKRGVLYGFITPYRECCEPQYLELELPQLIVYGFCRVHSYAGYGIVNTEGVEVLKANCTSVIIHNENLVEFVRDGKQYLYFPQANIAHEEEYKTLKVMRNWIKLYDYSNYQGLYTTNGVKLFEAQYLDVFPVADDVYKAIDEKSHEVLNSEFWEKPSEVCEIIFQESQGFFRCKQGGRYTYISKETGCNLTDNSFFDAHDFQRTGYALVKTEPSEHFQLLDREGNIHGRYKNF